MKSMTGYAYKETSIDGITVSVEIKSYNSRFLDIYVNLPSWLSSLESEIKKTISGRILRGKVEVGIRIKENDPPIAVTINKNIAMTYYNVIKELANTLTLKEEPGLGMIMGLEGVLETETKRDAAKYFGILNPVLDDAIGQLEAERIREGIHTREDILSHLVILEESLKKISAYLPAIEASIKDNLRERFSEILGEKIDENRILAETAVLLMKYTISEELSRLSSHLKEFKQVIDPGSQGISLGKKLDFLSQEINREINTIGSKTPMLEVSQAVVEMKNALENIREQLRNVE